MYVQLSTLLKESDAFETFLKNPLVEKSEKTSVLNEICSKNSFQPTTKRFLGTSVAYHVSPKHVFPGHDSRNSDNRLNAHTHTS